VRQARVQLDLHTHWRAPGQASGVKVRLAAYRLPMTVKIAMRSLPAQTRIKWDGPYSTVPPDMRVVWGWPLADDWHKIGVYAGQANSDPRVRMRWTVSKRALRLQMGHEIVPIGPWDGVISCDPDEETPMRIVVRARPALYVPRQPPRVRPATPGPDAPFPEIVLP
jgi:hypothetical protein